MRDKPTYPLYMRPLQRSSIPANSPIMPELIKSAMDHYHCSEAEAIAFIKRDEGQCEYWRNDLYQVELRRHNEDLIQLNIRRIDGSALIRDWRHFQQIKNQLVGPECEAVELYPAESRLVDTSNKFHLWCIADPKFRWPFGWTERLVMPPNKSKHGGLKQR